MYLGVDIGTSGVKILLLSSEGVVIKTVNKSYKLLIPKSNWTEQNPNDWFEQTLKGLKEIIKGYEHQIKAISFSGQMHGMVLLDKNDEVIRNAILWNDQRTIKEVDYLNNEIGVERLISETGNIAVTGLTAPKILWVYNNEIDNFNKINKVLLPKDYVVYKLTNEFVTDRSDVSGTLYYDIENKKYSKFMLEVLKLKEENFPKVFESYEVVGNLTDEIKVKLGIKQDVKVIIGGGDQALGAVGVGVVNEGDTNISLGTSGVVYTPMNNFNSDSLTNMQVYLDATGKYHMMGVMLSAAGSLKWWLEDVSKKYDYNALFNSIKHIEVDNSLFYLPYLSGERAPINDPDASGTFIGIRAGHRKEHLDRAVIEGISFNLKQIYENIENKGVKVTKTRVTGGGAKSEIWVQMLADIFNLPVETIEIEEGPALGAAILAMVGDGKYETVIKACENIIKPKALYVPNKENVLLYEEKYRKFKKIYPEIKNVFKVLK